MNTRPYRYCRSTTSRAHTGHATPPPRVSIGLVSDPESRRGSLGWYRALDATLAQNATRKDTPLTMPVLAIGGELSYSGMVAEAMKSLADEVQGVVIPGTGHWVAEEAPEQLLEALTGFLSGQDVAERRLEAIA